MRAVVQRVKRAKVMVEDEVVSGIGSGLLVFLGIGQDDCSDDIEYLVEKIINLRIFEDESGKMDLSLRDKEGEMLVVSQFTLYGDCRKGRRPSFTAAADPDIANRYYEEFIEKACSLGVIVKEGIFGADMDIDLINDGPVTILLDSKKEF